MVKKQELNAVWLKGSRRIAVSICSLKRQIHADDLHEHRVLPVPPGVSPSMAGLVLGGALFEWNGGYVRSTRDGRLVKVWRLSPEGRRLAGRIAYEPKDIGEPTPESLAIGDRVRAKWGPPPKRPVPADGGGSR